MTRHTTYRDPALLFFGGAALLLLLVSMPATYAMVAPFHAGNGDRAGIVLALATLLAFEVGAVGCKLVTLAIPTWNGRMNVLTIILLLLTTIANYANGYDLFASATLNPTLASIRAAGYGWLVATVYSATVPILLFVFLSATVARAKHLHASTPAGTPTATLTARRDEALISALNALAARLSGDSAAPAPALPPASIPALPDSEGDSEPDRTLARTGAADSKTAKVQQLARELGVSESTVWRRVKAGTLRLDDNG